MDDEQEENKNKKVNYNREKDNGMILDDDYNVKRKKKRIQRGGYKHKRKSKYIMNFK